MEHPKPTQSKPTPAQRTEARKRYVQGGGSVREIAKELSLSYDTVHNWSKGGRWSLLRAELAKRELDRLLGPVSVSQATPDSDLDSTKDNPQLSRLRDQLKKIEEKMSEADTEELAKLSIAHDRLFRAWQVLSGTPNPGSRKVRQERSPRSAGRSLAGPMEAAPAAPQSVPETLPVVIPPAAPEVKP